METLTLQPACAPRDSGPDVRLVAIDIDGTLLSSRKELKSATARAIYDCATAGTKVVLASARPPRTVRAIHKALRLDTLSIHYNGALVSDLLRGKNLFHYPMEPKLVRGVVKAARRADARCLVNVEILDKWYTDMADDPAGLMAAVGARFEPNFVAPLDAFLTVPVTKLTILTPPDRFEAVHRAISRRFSRFIVVGLSDRNMIQVLRRGADKSVALRRVAQHYGVEASQVMAIGDAPNDAGMLRWAGLGVAVGNAHPVARQAANVMAPSNDELGVAHALRKFILN